MKQKLQALDLSELFELCSSSVTEICKHYLKAIPSLELKSAMEYSLLNNGKFLRPLLVFATGAIFNAATDNLAAAASAIEMIHTYSLIHDDLPAMDNADMRRGKPANHIVHGNALAILAGDALQTLAFQVLVEHPSTLKPHRKLQLVQLLAQSSGAYGMAGGQSLDITALDDETISEDLLLTIYRLKTGALFSASIESGWWCSEDEDDANLSALRHFADAIGLAFQIQDDVLDLEATSAQLGKTTNNDSSKLTYPRLHGVERAKQKIETLYERGLDAINYLGTNAALLRAVTEKMLCRQY